MKTKSFFLVIVINMLFTISLSAQIVTIPLSAQTEYESKPQSEMHLYPQEHDTDSIDIIKLSAQVEHIYLSEIENLLSFYYCEDSVTSIIVHKPKNLTGGGFYSEAFGYIEADQITITPQTQGWLYWRNGNLDKVLYICFLSSDRWKKMY